MCCQLAGQAPKWTLPEGDRKWPWGDTADGHVASCWTSVSQAIAIVIASAIAVGGYFVSHSLGRRADRKQAEERAVANLATAAMAVLSMSRFQEAFGKGPRWRQLLPGSPPAMPRDVAIRVMERGFDRLDDVVRAHGELLQHARADLVDVATDVLDACIAVTEAWGSAEGADVDCATTQRDLGRARLRLLRASRGSRSRRWWLGRPALLNNLDE